MGIRPARQILARMSAVVSNVGLGAQATLLRIANGISRTVAVHLARHYAYALDVRVGIRNRSLWTRARVGTLGVGARGPVAASIRPRALVYIHALFESVSRESWPALATEPAQSVRADRISAAASRRPVYRVALVYINASSRDVVRIERPSVLADAVSLVAVRLAVRVISASYLVARCFTRYMGRGSNEARLAFAVITAPRVAADRRRPARVRKTLVHIHALGSDRFEPVLAEASPLDALGVVHTIEVRLAERGHVGLLASDPRIWIGSVSRWTDAVVTGILVLANRVSPAGALQRRALVDVAASLKRIPSVVRLATAYEAADRVAAFSVLAARVCLTFVHVFAQG